MKRYRSGYCNRAGFLSWKVWIAIAITPLVIGILAAVGIGIYEWQATNQLAARYESYRQLGEPYDNASLDEWYRAHTHTEATQDWLDIIAALRISHLAEDLPVLGGDKSLPTELRAGANWDDEQVVGSFLAAEAALRTKVLNTIELAKPAYFPIEFNGSLTLLGYQQESRNIQYFLKLDFEYAYYKGDTKRAMEDLVAMQKFVKVMDAPASLVQELFAISLHRVHLECVARSLTHNQWSEEELQNLLGNLQTPYYQPERWKNCIHGERALQASLTLEDLYKHSTERIALDIIPLTPSGRLRILKAMDETASLYQVPLSSLRSSAGKLQSRIHNESLGPSFDGAAVYIGLVFPSIESTASAFVRAEDTRNWTRTAVAIRLYRLQKKEWPTSLLDLKEVGLGPTDVQLVEGGRFGYEVEDGVAYLWSTDYRNGRLSPDRPKPDTSSTPDEQPANLIILR